MLWALLASALLHLWLAGGTPSGPIRMTVPLPVHRLEARLEHVARSFELLESAYGVVNPGAVELTPSNEDTRSGVAPTTRSVDLGGGAAAIKAAPDVAVREMPRAASAATDPVYYSARELDIYPVPLVPIQFEYPAHLVQAHIAGEVRVRLQVDEAGTVDQAAVIDAQPPGYFEEYARAAFASVHFSPGRREGRAVKSQVTVQVSFDPVARAGKLR